MFVFSLLFYVLLQWYSLTIISLFLSLFSLSPSPFHSLSPFHFSPQPQSFAFVGYYPRSSSYSPCWCFYRSSGRVKLALFPHYHRNRGQFGPRSHTSDENHGNSPTKILNTDGSNPHTYSGDDGRYSGHEETSLCETSEETHLG